MHAAAEKLPILVRPGDRTRARAGERDEREVMVAAILLALASSLGYGASDFAGGLAARGAHVLRVVAVAAPAGLVVSLAMLPLGGSIWTPSAVAWGGGSGVASAAAFALLYRTLALGPMSILSPLTAVISGIIPVLVGLAEGERLGGLAWVGLVAALVAIVLVSGGPAGPSGRASRRALVLATGAGVAVAGQLICLHQAPSDSGLAPLVAGGAVSSALLVTLAAARRRQLGAARPRLRLAVGSGALSALANLAFLVAVRTGDLSIVAVITALYPAGTVLLARIVLGERLHRVQLAGLAVAAGAVSLLAIG